MVDSVETVMADRDEDEEGRRPDRLWRMEQRQTEIISRIDRMQVRIDEAITRRDGHDWRVENFMATLIRQLDELLKRPEGGAAGLLGGEMTPFIKVVIGGLLSLIAALAFGKAFVFPG